MRAFHENRLYGKELPISVFDAESISFLAHWHGEMEFVYVCSGSIRMGINQESRILKQGDLAVCGSGDIHYYDSTDMKSTVIIAIFHPRLMANPIMSNENSPFVCPFIEAEKMEGSEGIQAHIKGLFYSLKHELEKRESYYDLFIRSRLLELYATILRLAPPSLEYKNGRHSLPGTKSMQKALDFIEKNYMNDITLCDAAKTVNISSYYFSRLFKRVAGMNFKPYVNRLRIQKAHEMLLTTNASIISIAFECGFNSVRSFNRAFKEIKGFVPSDLR